MDSWNPRANDIFLQALDCRSRRERSAYVDEACGANAELRAQVESLLSASERAGSFLDEPAVAPPATGEFLSDDPPTSDPRPIEGPGTRIGPYKLLQQIGEGGMGIVYMAEQLEPVRRKVALKIIKPGMDSAQVIARFEAERQALALMDHQNIAKVFDAGMTDTGRPYFVMELVHGVPITQFCDDSQLTPRERLALFVPVCQAIQHAHQKGIIHRDIKPSNVLVTMYDDKPVPKVIDFGVAKAIEQRLTEKTLFTQFGVLVGTFEYMSPEQAEMNAFGVDTRSDIYALGVLLYELLTGTTPLQRERLREAALSELVRLIKEEEPQRPSVRLSSSNTLPKIAAARRTEPAKLSKLVRGEIDWIVMKCLEKDRSRRYETANGLARDVERYLHDESVEACPPSAGYRLRKFAHKFRTPVIFAAMFALLLVAGVVVSAWQAVRARHSEREAIMKRQEAEDAQVRAQSAEQEIRRLWYAATINLMQQAWDTGQVGRLRDLLAETQAYPDRGFEWYYWQRLCHLELHTLIGHRARVTAVSWSPDGKLLATGSDDGTAKVWEAASGRELLTFRRFASASVSWSPDGKLLASGSDDGTVKLWEAASGRELHILKGHTSPVSSASWSPDGKLLATGSEDGVRVWEVASRRELLTLQDGVDSVSWSPDGKRLATGSWQTAKVWEVASRREVLTFNGLKGHTGVFVSWSPDGKRLATASGDGTAKIWDAAGGRELLTLRGHTGRVHSVSWSPDGKRLATGSEDSTAKVWEAASGRELLTLKGHTRSVSSVSWSPDGQRLATGSDDGTAKVWEAACSRESLTLNSHTDWVLSVSWSPDGKRLAAGCGEDGTARVWDAAGGRELLTFKADEYHVWSLSWSPDGQRLATGGGKVWEAAGGRPLLTVGKQMGPWSVFWSPDGKFLATDGENGTAKVWDAAGGREPLTLKGHTGAVYSVSWSPDGKRLATGSNDSTAKVWDAAGGRELLTLKGHTGAVYSVSWSPDGKRLATGSEDSTAKVWEAADGRELRTLKGHARSVSSVSWSPDGQRLATGSGERLAVGVGDWTAKVWDTADGRELLTLKGHTQPVSSVSWSPDGQRLATGSIDGTAKVWETAGAEALQEWARQDRAREELLEDFLALNDFRGPQAQGFIQSWLLLLPFPFTSAENGAQALDQQQLHDEAQLRPRLGQRVAVGDQELVWREHRSPEAVVDFNAVLGQATERSVAYVACYLESDQARNDLWLQVYNADHAKVYINGREISQRRCPAEFYGRGGLYTIGPVVLEQGANVLLFKVVNEWGGWEGCVRLVDEAGRPAKGIRVTLTPEP